MGPIRKLFERLMTRTELDINSGEGTEDLPQELGEAISALSKEKGIPEKEVLEELRKIQNQEGSKNYRGQFQRFLDLEGEDTWEDFD